MTLKLKPSSPAPPFSWSDLPSTPPPDTSSPTSPPTSWLSAKDMKLFGVNPLAESGSGGNGVVRCAECAKPVLAKFMREHMDNCNIIRAGGKKGSKGKLGQDTEGSKKRKLSPSPPLIPGQPPKKKPKVTPKVNKGRFKGPIDYDRHCGVINDKNLPCSRSLTCKSHSMGAKRAVQGRSRNYDELLIEWQRANNPNWVEPVKRETKAEKKEKKERERLEKKRLAGEAAAASGGAGVGDGKKQGKKGQGKKAAAAAASGRMVVDVGEDADENMEDVDSEVEVDELVRALRGARERSVVAVPLAMPCDAGSWFVQRRERVRCCRDLLVGALGSGGGMGSLGAGVGTGMVAMRTGSVGSRLG